MSSDPQSSAVGSGFVNSVGFSFYTETEARNLSSKTITKPDLVDAKGHPVPDGLYDPAMGPFNQYDSCKSCGHLSNSCQGHYGLIELPKPIYHPLLFNKLKSLLQITCFGCGKFRMKDEEKSLIVSKLDLIRNGDVIMAKDLGSILFSEEPFPVTSLNSINPEKVQWSSLQYSEARDVLDKFMKVKPKECGNCGTKKQKISAPIFGWLNKESSSSDIRANIIKEYDIGLISAGDGINAGVHKKKSLSNDAQSMEVDSLTNKESLVSTKPSKKAKHLKDIPPEFIKKMSSSGKTHILPSEVEALLKLLWNNEEKLCMYICDFQGASILSGRENCLAMFFLKVLLVPPNKFRPSAGSADRGVLEHPQNILLGKVLQANISFSNSLAPDQSHSERLARWMDLQNAVNFLYDSSKAHGKRDKDINGIRQIVEKKHGILRQKIMGKRVNYACRSVISPDPFLAVNEIGIPPYFAMRLTYPERVTPWNVAKLRRAVINGAHNHPGAMLYKDKGITYRLPGELNRRKSLSRKLSISQGTFNQTGTGPLSESEGMVVYRHLQDGDVVLVNRQPTLHKPSMMAHVVRVLKGEKTIRMHYANCSTYNADFDGDEMNVHFPQDEISRAEAMNIVNANMQYIVPTTGEPIRGLIQDHIVGAVLLTTKDRFLTREEFHQLLCASCVSCSNYIFKSVQKVATSYDSDFIESLPPAILKPKPLWTGKQVITAILWYITRGQKPFTMLKEGKINKEFLGEDWKHEDCNLKLDEDSKNNISDLKFEIYNNEFIRGFLDKSQFGVYGLVHIIHELYGSKTAGLLLSALSLLSTSFLQMHGFTCGLDDLLVTKEADLERERMLERSEVLSKNVHVSFASSGDTDIDQKPLEKEIEKVIRSNRDSSTLLDRMMSSALNPLVSAINKTLIPGGLYKPFRKNCMSLMTSTGAKGGHVNMTQISSLLGQQELEGKRVPRMVSGKTLPCFLPWDISCRAGGFIGDRFLTGLRPQEYYFHCMAGRDGLVDTAVKTSRSGYLQRCLVKNLESLKVGYDLTVRDADGSVIQFMYGEDGVDVMKSSFLSQIDVLAKNHNVILESLSGMQEITGLSKSNGVIKNLPEKLKEEANSYIKALSKKQRGSFCQVKKKDVRKLMKLKYQSSLADPGEPVGVLAAQSIGEPSTQMTLNTFHLAGHGDVNMTLGIPRLQEILMNARENIRTPVMKCPLVDGKTREDAEVLSAKLRRVTLADIVENIEVRIIPFSKQYPGQSNICYKLTIKLHPPELYPPQFGITLEACEKVLRSHFVEALEVAITKHFETAGKIRGINIGTGAEVEDSYIEGGPDDDNATKKVTEDDVVRNDSDEEGDEISEDQCADVEKRRTQRSDEIEYEDGMEKESGIMSDDEHDGHQSEDEFGTVNDNSDADEGGTTRIHASFLKPKADHVSKNVDEVTTKGRKKKINRIKTVHFKKLEFVAEIRFSRKEPHILLSEIAQRVAKRVFVKFENIEKCSIIESNKREEPLQIQTAGVNFTTLWGLDEDYLDVKRIRSNDVHAMLKTYGVEAAKATIQNEVDAVFESYGIRVNIRHLYLIAEFMTFNGDYRPMNRLGMEHYGTSPFGKMSFETATKFITEAASHREVDTLESPSASICLGQPVRMGTGCFDVVDRFLFC